MKQLGYAALFLMFVMIIIPAILVKSCSSEEIPIQENKSQEALHTIKVYIASEDKVVEMNFNEYLKGVVAAEMPASFNMEALKAQAVVARTYVFHRLSSQAKTGEQVPEHKGADVCTNSGHCSAWIDKKEAMNKWGILSAKKYWNKISSAVDDTANIIITYDNEPIDAVFHSTSSGRTENSEDVWTNTIPYLRSIISEGEEKSPKYKSTVTFSKEEFLDKLKANYPECEIASVQEQSIGTIERTEGGSVKTIQIGNQVFKGTEIRKLFDLNSANFTITFENENVAFNVIGNGHGVGMSQYGANYLAAQGKTYEDILKTYYKSIDLARIEK